MKKILLAPILGICMAMPAYSTILTGSDNECNEPILNTDIGPAELRAIWGANTINLDWYSDNTKITPANNTANTCLYDGAIILPTNTMTKTGYTFGGWRVREQCSLSGLDANIGVDVFYARDLIDFCHVGSSDKVSTKTGSDVCITESSAFSDVDVKEFKMEFSYGTLKGTGECSSTGAQEQGATGNPSDTFGNNCWCKVTNYIANNGKSCSVISPWVFLMDFTNNIDFSCQNVCAGFCAYAFAQSSETRAYFYSLIQ